MQFIFKFAAALSRLVTVVFGVVLISNARAATMTPETLESWNVYIQRSQAELMEQSSDPDHFLWIERRPVMKPVQFHDDVSIYSPHGGGIPVPSGLVHHWIGTIFIPNANVAGLLDVLKDYDSYSAIYSPGVVESKLMTHNRNDFTYRLKFVQKGFGIKAGLLADFKSTYCQLTPEVGYNITQATRLTELANVETPSERPLSFQDSHGYVEKVFTVVRYRQVSGGLYLEVETFTLSRDVPAAIRWAVSPVIQRFSRQTMADTLHKLSDRVQNTRAIETAANDTLIASSPAAR